MLIETNGSCSLFYNVVKLNNCSPIGSHNYFENLDWFIKFKNWGQHLCHPPLMCSSDKYSEGLLGAKRWSTNMKKTALCAHRERGTRWIAVTKKVSGARFPGSLSGGINRSLNRLKLSCLENAQVFCLLMREKEWRQEKTILFREFLSRSRCLVLG